MARSEHKRRYDAVNRALLRAIKDNEQAEFPKLLKQLDEFPTLKAKYEPQLKPVKTEPRDPNGDPFDTLYRRQRR